MSLLLHRPLPIRQTCTRALSITSSRQGTLHIEKNDPDLIRDTVPPYPYGPARWYKQSNSGLYGTSRVRFGNNVGPKFETKTRRSWHPNIVRKKLWSHALGRGVQVKVQARVLRTIDKSGGLDEYLLGDKAGRVKELGVAGWWLRWAICQTPRIRARFAAERGELGIPETGIEPLIEEQATTDEGEAQVEVKGNPNAIIEPIPTRRSQTFRQARLLKFRVGRGTHMVFTSRGWRRARPDPMEKKRRWLVTKDPLLSSYVEKRMKEVEPAPSPALPTMSTPAGESLSEEGLLQQVLQESDIQLTLEEEKAVRKAVKKELKKQKKEIVDDEMNRFGKMMKARRLI